MAASEPPAEVFECNICMEKHLYLKALPCGHDLCTTCLNTLVDLKQQKLSCHMCRQLHEIQDGSCPEKSFPNKFKGQIECQICHLRKPLDDIWYCSKCICQLCSKCQLKVHRDHGHEEFVKEWDAAAVLNACQTAFQSFPYDFIRQTNTLKLRKILEPVAESLEELVSQNCGKRLLKLDMALTETFCTTASPLDGAGAELGTLEHHVKIAQGALDLAGVTVPDMDKWEKMSVEGFSKSHKEIAQLLFEQLDFTDFSDAAVDDAPKKDTVSIQNPTAHQEAEGVVEKRYAMGLEIGVFLELTLNKSVSIWKFRKPQNNSPQVIKSVVKLKEKPCQVLAGAICGSFAGICPRFFLLTNQSRDSENAWLWLEVYDLTSDTVVTLISKKAISYSPRHGRVSSASMTCTQSGFAAYAVLNQENKQKHASFWKLARIPMSDPIEFGYLQVFDKVGIHLSAITVRTEGGAIRERHPPHHLLAVEADSNPLRIHSFLRKWPADSLIPLRQVTLSTGIFQSLHFMPRPSLFLVVFADRFEVWGLPEQDSSPGEPFFRKSSPFESQVPNGVASGQIRDQALFVHESVDDDVPILFWKPALAQSRT